MKNRAPFISGLLLLFIFVSCAGNGWPRWHDPFRVPGPTSRGAVALPNGWMITPVGNHLEIGDFPMAVDTDPNEEFAAVVFSGASEQGVSIVSLSDFSIKSKAKVKRAWLGGKFIDNGRKYILSGAADDVLHLYHFDRVKGVLTKDRDLKLKGDNVKETQFAGGLDADTSGAYAFVALQLSGKIAKVNLTSGAVEKTADVGEFPYTCKISRDGKSVFVSLWAGKKLVVLNSDNLQIQSSLEVGPHPNAICELKDGRILVACANDNTVAVVDPAGGRVLERIKTTLAPNSPPGSTPNSITIISERGERPTVAVANADNNTIAWIELSKKGAEILVEESEEDDEEEAGASRVLGFSPTAWYPADVRFLKNNNSILVVSGKGLGSHANPAGPLSPLRPKGTPSMEGYVGALMKGTLTKCSVPDPDELAKLTLQSIHNSPYRVDHKILAHPGSGSAIPARPGDPTPIKYVLYIIKENRTYDQVFGAIETGNGDPRLQIFGPDVAPNHHALAREFVLLDNTYADAEVSAGGHQWSMGAYATDFTEKIWHTIYGPGGGHSYTFEGEGLEALVKPQGGYLWDLAARSNVTYRSFGEFVENPKKRDGIVTTTIPALKGHTSPKYWGWDLSYKDVDRANAYMEEFREFEKQGDMPRLQILRLPNDHTSGTSKNHPTPRAMVADNDLALGRIVETVSKSQFWKETAIFVLEDDAQNGPDHVDAHRMIAFVISPWTKRKFTDSTFYSTSSFLRTIELILKLPPMSQFDAAAMPMWRSFTNAPDFTTYSALTPAISLSEMNLAGAYGQDRCAEMNLTIEDAIPEIEFNEIIWKSVRGEDSPMPAPVRAPWTAWAEYFTIMAAGN